MVGLVGLVGLVAGGALLAPTAGWAAPPTPPAEQELVAVTINSAGQSTPAYQVEVINRTVAPVDVTLRLGVPADAAVATVSSGGQPAETEVTWQLSLPASGTESVHASFRPGGSGAPEPFPVCVYQRDTTRPYDCATAQWSATASVEGADQAWWQRPSLPLLGGLAVLTVVTMIGYGWRRRIQKHQVTRRRVVTAGGRRVRLPSAPPAPPPPVGRRWRPTTPMVFGLLIAMLTGLAVATVRGATYGSTVLDRANQAPSGWIGTTQTGGLGVLLTESAFEFTVYRMACAPAGGQQHRCVATVALRNRSDDDQFWYAPLQRAYLPTGDWVAVDEATTRQENGGRDIFAEPVPAGARLLVPLAFTVSGELVPQRLELRSGAFSAGVSVT
ncbi:hypothetical protein [Micromonospora sp. NBC_01813]|uniref:hypothetical protein n=1 Tax=Micromonospora sp. NBC_01813 TaxID=2975988 RepID=UPI002DD8F789|nr:hypothetical protein [Micromonospora sp. NBC_01813]WSA11844.1 hypothetical protein OG958_14290 [Micromonospora sp. NBC_01813]